MTIGENGFILLSLFFTGTLILNVTNVVRRY